MSPTSVEKSTMQKGRDVIDTSEEIEDGTISYSIDAYAITPTYYAQKKDDLSH